MALLLDTCALIFYTSEDKSSRRAELAVNEAYRRGEALYISPISAWEIGQLAAGGKIRLPKQPHRWFDETIERARLSLCELTPSILIASSFLPDSPLRDPADKIIAATAREFDYTVLTSDRLLLDYARRGHLRAMPC